MRLPDRRKAAYSCYPIAMLSLRFFGGPMLFEFSAAILFRAVAYTIH